MGEWRECKIGEVISLEYGKSLQNYREGKSRFDVYGTNGKIGTTEVFLYDKPSIIIGRKGAYREVHLAKTPFYVIDTAFYTKKIINEISNLFLYYWFKKVNINSMDSGSAIPSTSRDEVYDLDILLPPLPEQKAIAEVLSSLDDKIDLLHRQNRTLEQLAETLFRQWFVEEAEEDWWKTIDEIDIDVIDGDRGKNYPNSSELLEEGFCLFLSAKNVTANGFDISQKQYISKEKDSLLRKGKLQRGDIILTTRGTVGNFFFYDHTIPFENIRINSGMIILRSSKFDPILFYSIFKSIFFKKALFEFTSGSAQPQIPIRDFKKIIIPFPESDIIKKYLTTIKPIYDKKFGNNNQIRTLEKLRDTLLPKLMSGEVRVEI